MTALFGIPTWCVLHRLESDQRAFLFVGAVAAGLFVFYSKVQTVSPTTCSLNKDLSRRSPWIVTCIGMVVDALPWSMWEVCDAEALLQKGAQEAGLPPLYPEGVREGIETLCASLRDDDVKLHWFGRVSMHSNIVMGLSQLLQLEEAHRRDPSLSSVRLLDPIVVVGMPRAGTTLMHNLLAQAPDSRALPLWEILRPVPPRKGLDLRRLSLKMQFGFWTWLSNRFGVDAIHYIRPDLADECTIALRMGGASHVFWGMAPVHGYLQWMCDGRPKRASYRAYRKMLQLLQAQFPDRRFVLKSPCHSLNLLSLAEAIPEAQLVCMHRDPLQVAASDASLTARLHAVSVTHLDWQRVARSNADKLAVYASNLVSFARTTSPSRVYHAAYWRLLADPYGLVEDIQQCFGLQTTAEHKEKIKRYLAANTQHSRGKHHYSLEGVGLSASELSKAFEPYFTHFSFVLRPTD